MTTQSITLPRSVVEQAAEMLDLSQAMLEESMHHGNILNAYTDLRVALQETKSESENAAETWLRARYGAYRAHAPWRELEDAFNAGAAHVRTIDTSAESVESAAGNQHDATAKVVELLASMEDDLRIQVFSAYGTHCGCNDPRCQCWNDE